MAYLNPQLRLTVQDKRETERELSFYYPQGLVEWVKERSKNEKPVSEVLTISYDFEIFDSQDYSYCIGIHLAFQWLDSEKQGIISFTNTIETQDGGTHLTGLIAALCKHLEIRRWPAIRRGFNCIIHILHPEPLFKKTLTARMTNNNVYPAIDEAVEALFAAHPDAKAAIQAHFGRR